MTDTLRRLRISRTAESAEVLQFWRDHGTEWARDEASHADLQVIGTLAERISNLPEARAVQECTAELRQIWRSGFLSPEDAFGWNEMNDQLPDRALHAFVLGAGAVWSEVKLKL